MTKEVTLPPQLAALYEELCQQLVRIVGSNLTASDELIEDACQVAWGSLIRNREMVAAGEELGWLSTTATRELLRQLRSRRHEVSYEDEHEQQELASRPDPAPGPERVAELRERLTGLDGLSPRQRRILWMQGLGYHYEEISTRTGDSPRTVERQLLAARRRLARSA